MSQVLTISSPRRTMADLLERLGDVPLRRVLADPAPGTATEQDVIDLGVREKRLCELVDGVLVEKPMGYYESRVAAELIILLGIYLRQHDLGVVAGEAGLLRLMPGLVRIPDVSFVSWGRMPDPQGPRPPIPTLAPDLAVEVLSESNTEAEMERKLREYFAAGARLVWYIDREDRTARVYTAPDQSTLLDETQALDGGDVLPGFALPLRELFERADRHRPAGQDQG
jgi:Uma2 family endonuclease